MAQLNDAIHQWDDTYNNSKRSKIDRCLIQKTNIKKTLNEAANPTEHRAASLKDPHTGKLTCDTKRLTEIFSATLLTLGGPLNYEPNAHTAQELLQHTPQCPPTIAITPTPEISWHRFTSYLHSCKPSKADGRDSTNGYLFHISPEPVKRFLLHISRPRLTSHHVSHHNASIPPLDPDLILSSRQFYVQPTRHPHGRVPRQPSSLQPYPSMTGRVPRFLHGYNPHIVLARAKHVCIYTSL